MRRFNVFDYKWLVKNMEKNKDTRKTVEKYSMYYGPQDDVSIYDTPFYRDYLSQFEIPFNLVVPKNLEDCFDWDLLFRLVLGSFSSDYDLKYDGHSQQGVTKVRMKIKINCEETGDNENNKGTDIYDMWCYQVCRLFEIFVEEQMNACPMKSDAQSEEDDNDDIKEMRRTNLQKYNLKMIQFGLNVYFCGN